MSTNPWTEEERQIVAQIDCEGTITGNEEGGDDIIDLSTVSRRGTTATIVAVTMFEKQTNTLGLGILSHSSFLSFPFSHFSSSLSEGDEKEKRRTKEEKR